MKLMNIIVYAHPKSKRPRVAEREPGIYDVYVAEPPVDGKANQAIEKSLANYFGIAQSRVQITKGATGKRKTVELSSFELRSMM